METLILAENEREVRIQVKSENKVWEITIPFMDNEGAELVNKNELVEFPSQKTIRCG